MKDYLSRKTRYTWQKVLYFNVIERATKGCIPVVFQDRFHCIVMCIFCVLWLTIVDYNLKQTVFWYNLSLVHVYVLVPVVIAGYVYMHDEYKLAIPSIHLHKFTGDIIYETK